VVTPELPPKSRRNAPAGLRSTSSPARIGGSAGRESIVTPRSDGGSNPTIKTFRDPIMCKRSDNEFRKLRITRAYIKLLCIPEGDAKMVSLTRIGNFEIRMFEDSKSSSGAAPLFSIELFDHEAQSPVDSCVCYDIGEGATAYQDFISR
jgi:hypothetical protein